MLDKKKKKVKRQKIKKKLLVERFLVLFLFFPNTSDIFAHGFLVLKVSTDNYIEDESLFSHSFQNSHFGFGVLKFDYNVVQCESECILLGGDSASWICRYMCFIKLGMF